MKTINLETSRKIGAEIRLSGVHLTKHLALINGLYTPQGNESSEELKAAKNLIGSHIQAMLAGASMIKVGATDPSNPTEEESKEARRKIWLSIKQVTSKQGYFFVDGERPQARQGSNWLVSWGVPQVKTKVTETVAPETVAPETVAPETVAPETVAPVEIPAPSQGSFEDRLLEVHNLIETFDVKDLSALKKYITALIKDKNAQATVEYAENNGIQQAA